MTDTADGANVQLIRKLYAAMGASAPDDLLALLSDDVEFVVPGPPSVGAAGVWRGHAGVTECLRKLREGQENQLVDFLDFIADGDNVVVRLHVRAKALATGKIFESDIVHLFTIRDGTVTRLLDFFDTWALFDAYQP